MGRAVIITTDSPATEGTCKVSVRQLPLQRRCPALALSGVTAVHDSAVQPIDISRRASLSGVAKTDDKLSRESTFGDVDLA